MTALSAPRAGFRARAAAFVMVLGTLVLGVLTSPSALAAPGKAPPERAEVIMIGDRLVNVAYHLGVVPRALSIRGDVWSFGRTLANTTSIIMGCPAYIVKKDPDMVPRILRQTGVKRILVERSPEFDRLKPFRDPMKAVPLLEKSGVLEDLGVTIEIVDFGEGIDSAIRQVGTLLDRSEPAEALIQRRASALERANKGLPLTEDGGSVVILNGVHQAATGKGFVRVELPGGYADTFLLEPLGLTNAGGAFVEAGAKARHGFATVRTLDLLKTIRPDALVLTGDADAVQRKLIQTLAQDPAFADIPAIARGAVVTLPAYVDSSVIEYPAVLRRWAVTIQTALAAR